MESTFLDKADEENKGEKRHCPKKNENLQNMCVLFSVSLSIFPFDSIRFERAKSCLCPLFNSFNKHTRAHRHTIYTDWNGITDDYLWNL